MQETAYFNKNNNYTKKTLQYFFFSFLQFTQKISINIVYSRNLLLQIKKMVKLIGDYILHQKIGEGSYGLVYRAINQKNNQQYAIKAIEYTKFKQDPVLEQGLSNQVRILKRLEKCEHIIQFYETMKNESHLYLVYEFCNQGTLEGMISKNKTFTETMALKIFKQLLIAFEILQKQQIIHRDVKPENIFISNGKAKLGDFGFCKNLSKIKTTNVMLGSPVYMAPEVLREEDYTTKADIWSLGVVLYEMLFGLCPFQSHNIPGLIKILQNTQLKFPQNIEISNQTKQLLCKMLTKDQLIRINWADLFQIPISKQGKYIETKPKTERVQRILSKNVNNMAKTTRILQASSKHACSNINLNFPKNYISHNNLQKNLINKKYTIAHTPTHKNKVKQIQKQHKSLFDTSDSDFGSAVMKLKRQRIYTIHCHSAKQDKKQNLRIIKAKSIKTKIIEQTNKQNQGNRQQHNNIMNGLMIAKKLQSISARHSTLFSIIIYRVLLERLQSFSVSLSKSNDCPEIKGLVKVQLKQISIEKQKLQQNNTFLMGFIAQYEKNHQNFLKSKVPECKSWKLCFDMLNYLYQLDLKEPNQNDQKNLQQQVIQLLDSN